MKSIFLFLFPVIFLSVSDWHNNIDEAKQLAKKEHKHILLNFSGSDWCGPCIRMHREIFEDNSFEKMAGTELVLVNADFPRMKKNQLPVGQQEINNLMAERYNPKGRFPFTVLLNADGKILKEWDGFPNAKPKEFCDQVMAVIESDR
jgi:thioredoxin-related protein